MFVMSTTDKNAQAIVSAIQELTRLFKQSSAYDSQLGAARASRTKTGNKEHKMHVPDEEYRMRHHFIDSLRHVNAQEVKERQKQIKKMAETEQNLSKIVRKHVKAYSEADSNLKRMNHTIDNMERFANSTKNAWKKQQQTIKDNFKMLIDQRNYNAELRNQMDQLYKDSKVGGITDDIVDQLKSTLQRMKSIIPAGQFKIIQTKLNKIDPANITKDMENTFRNIASSMHTRLIDQATDMNQKLNAVKQEYKDLLNSAEAYAQRHQNLIPHMGTVDAIRRVNDDLQSGLAQFADMFGKDKLATKFSNDASTAIAKFRKNMEELADATDPKEIKKLDKLVQAQAQKAFTGVRRYEERIAKLRGDDSKKLFGEMREKFSLFIAKIKDGAAIAFGDPAAAGGMLMDKLGDLFGGILGKVAGGVQFLIKNAASVVMKEIVPDRLALMKYGTFLTGSGGNGLEWTENLKLASRMGMKSTELAQMRAEQRALLLTSSGGEARILDSIGDIVYGISKEGRGTSLGKGKDPMGHYFGGSTQDRVEASLAGLTMLRNSGIVSSFENLGNMMEQYTIENQNITGLTQQQLFTYASDIMNLSDNQELLSGATEEQQKAMLANTFKLQQVYAGLGYSAEESKALTEEMAKMRKGMSGKDKLRSLATVPMMGSMMGLNQTQMSFLQGATEANAKGSVAFEQFMAQNGNVEILKGINTSFQGILQGNQGLMQKILFEELLSKIPEFQQIMSFAPGSAKRGVTKTDVSNRNRMTANTVIEDKAIMTLDASLKSWNDGMLHGVLSMGQVSTSFASIAKSVDATGSSLGPMLTTASNGISALIKYLNIGHLFDSAELTARISKVNAFSESVNAVAGMGKDKRGFFGKLVPFKDPKWNYSASEFDTLTDTLVRLYAPDSAKRGNKSVHLTSSTRDFGDFALNNKGQYVWTSQGNYNATQIQDITNAMRQLVVDKAEEEKKKAEAEENALRDSESKLIESNGNLKGSIDKLKIAVDDNNKVRGGAQSTAPVTPPQQPGKPGGVPAEKQTTSDARSSR